MKIKNNNKGKKDSQQMSVDNKSNIQLHAIILISIVFYIIFLFSKSIHFQFVIYDDNSYVFNNELIKDLSFKGLKNILTTPVLGMYNPIPFIIYAIQYKYHGLDPRMFHFTSILFHIIASIVLYRFIFRLTGRYETAVIVTLLFAIHPMHVAVVTWVSQTKTSLMFIFYVSALYHYLKYLQGNYKVKELIYVMLFFILAALSKPDAVTLAPMLFLLDYYFSRKADKKMFLEKILFFMIAVTIGIVTLLTHSEVNDTIFDYDKKYSLINNILLANYSIVFYFNKLFYPMDLCTIYAYPENTTFLPLRYYLSIPVLPAIILLIYKSGKFRKEMVFGMLFFIIAISVLLRVVPAGFFFAANRYSYLSYTGLFFIFGQFITYVIGDKFKFSGKIKPYVIAFLMILIGFYSYRTDIRVSKWENTLTLFDDIIKKNSKLALAYNTRAFAKLESGDGEGALVDFNMAVQFDSSYADAYMNRGNLELSMGMEEKAAIDFDKAIKLNPTNGAIYYNRSFIKSGRKDMKGTLEDLRKADSLGHALAKRQIEVISRDNNFY